MKLKVLSLTLLYLISFSIFAGYYVADKETDTSLEKCNLALSEGFILNKNDGKEQVYYDVIYDEEYFNMTWYKYSLGLICTSYSLKKQPFDYRKLIKLN